MKIKNYESLVELPSSSKELLSRKLLLNFAQIGLAAVNPFDIVAKNLQYDTSSQLLKISSSKFHLAGKHVHVIGTGKAVGRMAEAIESILSDVQLSGIISVPEGVKQSLSLGKIQCVESTHPLPTEANIRNTQKTLNYFKKISPNDFVISLISGGGSALWSAPVPPITLNDLKELNHLLLHSGMSIHEMNVIRKHISLIKGGKAAALIPAPTLVLLLSDVIGDKIESIASGPFFPDRSTFNDVARILSEYNLSKEDLPNNINKILKRGKAGEISDTPKPDSPIFSRFHPIIIGSNSVARQAISDQATNVGLNNKNNEEMIEEEVRIVGRNLANLGLELHEKNVSPCLYIFGGEPTVKVKGEGIGGRNQEVVAAFLKELSKLDTSPDISLLSFGTDGIDGNSYFAGAICDRFTIETHKQKKIPLDAFQANNDLSSFFLELGKSLVILGPTGTNVMDIQLLLVNGSNLKENLRVTSEL